MRTARLGYLGSLAGYGRRPSPSCPGCDESKYSRHDAESLTLKLGDHQIRHGRSEIEWVALNIVTEDMALAA